MAGGSGVTEKLAQVSRLGTETEGLCRHSGVRWVSQEAARANEGQSRDKKVKTEMKPLVLEIWVRERKGTGRR